MLLRFYYCEICGKVITILSGDGIPTDCCGETMAELIPNRTDGAFDKHVPVFTVEGDTVHVRIGSEPHPMTTDHYISWIGLRTNHGFAFRELHPGELPLADFTLRLGDRVEAVYAYCNLHGLWYAEKETAK